MNRYAKYFLQNALWLEDGFCEYYVQDDFWGLQEILDVETLVFFWPGDALQWLAQCAEHDHAGTLHHLRDYLAHHSLRPHMLHCMDDARVMQAAAEELTENMSRVVIQPCAGWAVQLDNHTSTAEIPPRVAPEPELSEMLAELKGHLDAIVIEQQEKSARTEAQLANLTPEQKALFYSKKAGTGAYDGVVGGTWDMVKTAPSVLWSAAKAFPGFYVGYLKTLWKVAQTPSKMASLTARGMATGNFNPLKQEIDRIVTPVAATYEEALKYKSMLTLLFGNEQVYALLYDFAQRYYDATHPAELTEMAASAVADIVVTVILAIVTAGAGAAASVAAKSGRLVKVAKLLEKIAATLKRIGPRAKLLDKGHDAASTAAKVEKKAANAARKKGVPDVDHPKPAQKIDKNAKKTYDEVENSSGPKKTKLAQAEELLNRASAAEPKVTKDLSDLAKATGGKQEGLDFRLKTKESLARKLETTNPENINDSLRYTITYPSENIGAGANKVMKQLEDAGYTKVKVKNTFKSGSPYKGINTTFRTPDGQPFELQFHTPESFHAKQNLTHSMYEELRLLPGDSPKAEKLLKEIKAVSDENVPIPDGIQEAVPNS
jgi:hypothetical protein